MQKAIGFAFSPSFYLPQCDLAILLTDPDAASLGQHITASSNALAGDGEDTCTAVDECIPPAVLICEEGAVSAATNSAEEIQSTPDATVDSTLDVN